MHPVLKFLFLSVVLRSAAAAVILSDGDNVTCIPIKDQPSLIQPLVPLQLAPSTTVMVGSGATVSTVDRGIKHSQQTFAVEFGACPKGTIPVRETRDIFNLTGEGPYSSTEQSKRGVHHDNKNMHRKHPKISLPEEDAPLYNNSVHEHAYVIVEDPNNTTTYRGADVTFNLWSPYVEIEYEFSLAQLWLISGSYDGENETTYLNTIEAGYQVFKALYGDNKPRLFVYWTEDSYNLTGCYNLYCPGFVQVSNKVLMGGSFSLTSEPKCTLYDIELLVFRDPHSGNWWLKLDDEMVGYWPGALYTSGLQSQADYIEFGGEIIDSEGDDGNRHTKTQMGSGRFPSAGFCEAAYQRNIHYVDGDVTLQDAPLTNGLSEAPTCYDSLLGNSSAFADWGSYFYYGGSGFSKFCRHDPYVQ